MIKVNFFFLTEYSLSQTSETDSPQSESYEFRDSAWVWRKEFTVISFLGAKALSSGLAWMEGALLAAHLFPSNKGA